jgi:leucyl/phenylalanyl-tRNA--protein transferase
MMSDADLVRVPVEAESATDRRSTLFREVPFETARRWALGTLYAVKPHRINGLPALARLWLRDLVAAEAGLPDPSAALDNPYGLAGIAHDLSVPTLVAAYRRGLYPFSHIGPVKWWSPPERCVLFYGAFHMSKRLRSRLRQARYTVTFDRAFDDVIKACAAPRRGKWALTWITPQIMRAYADLHDAGHAHSFEVWNASGALVGGGYGVASGSVFVIESQFAGEDHTSKIGFSVLNWHLARWGFLLSDNKLMTQNVADMGFATVPRADYLAYLARPRSPTMPKNWAVETDLRTVAAWEPGNFREATLVPQE